MMLDILDICLMMTLEAAAEAAAEAATEAVAMKVL
jgi:hypothetical protein